MSWNPGSFCRSLEAGIFGLASAAGNAAAAERQIDRSGPAALSKMANAIRFERRRNADLTARNAALEAELAQTRALAADLSRQLRQRPRLS